MRGGTERDDNLATGDKQHFAPRGDPTAAPRAEECRLDLAESRKRKKKSRRAPIRDFSPEARRLAI